MGSRAKFLGGAVTILLVGACGGSSHKTSSRAALSTPATTISSPSSPQSASGLASRLATSSELPAGLKLEGPPIFDGTVQGWLADTLTPPTEVAPETVRLRRLGFVAGASEKPTGVAGAGLSLVERFQTPSAARAEVTNQVQQDGTPPGATRFKVTGIPGALGWANTGGGQGESTWPSRMATTTTSSVSSSMARPIVAG